MKRLIYLILLIPIFSIGQMVPFGFMETAVAGGAVPVIESTATNTEETSTTSYTVSKPSGLQVGDLLLVLVANEGTTDTDEFDATSAPLGWTFVTEAGSTLSDAHIAIFWIVATSTEVAASNFTFTSLNGTLKGFIGAMRISGVFSTPIGTVGSAYLANTATPAITGITTANDNSKALYMFAYDTSTKAPFTTPTTGWTEQDEFDTSLESANSIDGAWGYKDMATAGATGTASFTPTGAADGIVGIIIEIRSE